MPFRAIVADQERFSFEFAPEDWSGLREKIAAGRVKCHFDCCGSTPQLQVSVAGNFFFKHPAGTDCPTISYLGRPPGDDHENTQRDLYLALVAWAIKEVGWTTVGTRQPGQSQMRLVAQDLEGNEASIIVQASAARAGKTMEQALKDMRAGKPIFWYLAEGVFPNSDVPTTRWAYFPSAAAMRDHASFATMRDTILGQVRAWLTEAEDSNFVWSAPAAPAPTMHPQPVEAIYDVLVAEVEQGRALVRMRRLAVDPEDIYLYLHLPHRPGILTRCGRRRVWGSSSYWQAHPETAHGIYTSCEGDQVEAVIVKHLSGHAIQASGGNLFGE